MTQYSCLVHRGGPVSRGRYLGCSLSLWQTAALASSAGTCAVCSAPCPVLTRYWSRACYACHLRTKWCTKCHTTAGTEQEQKLHVTARMWVPCLSCYFFLNIMCQMHNITACSCDRWSSPTVLLLSWWIKNFMSIKLQIISIRYFDFLIWNVIWSTRHVASRRCLFCFLENIT